MAQNIQIAEIDAAFAQDIGMKPAFQPDTDLLSRPLGTQILAFSDEYFAAADNLITPTPPIRRPGYFVETGAWYDGWETRRHNTQASDWVVFRLGVASGVVAGVEVDTAHFNGNHAPAVSVEGCFEPGAAAGKVPDGGWFELLPRSECGPTQRHAWRLPQASAQVTHVRLHMYPDGGIARFRLYGSVVAVLPADAATVLDLAATVNGGVAVACSDQHFGGKHNLLLPGRGKDMGDGWETARSRQAGHVDWVVVKLGAAARYIDKIVVDTAHFRGNFPQSVQVYAAQDEGSGAAPAGDDASKWKLVLPGQKCGPDKEHEFSASAFDKAFVESAGQWRFVKMVIIPDGGVKRLRVYGRRG